jgi:single-strand DNA-binding protein
MANSLNKVQLIGNLTKDPELRQTPNGSSVCSFTVATNLTWKDANGQKQDKAEFHNIVTWGKLAEICNQYLQKGKKVYLEGRLQTRDWEAEDGSKRYKTEVVAENMIMLSQANSNYDSNSNSQSNDYAAQPSSGGGDDISIDDLPF